MNIDQYRQNWREANAPVQDEERIGRPVFALILIALCVLAGYAMGRADEADDIKANYICIQRIAP
jgi:hypothetical protein